MATELDAAPATLRRLLDRYQIGLVAPTRRQRAAAASRPSSRPGRSNSAARHPLAELGLRGLEAYLQDRSVGQGWSGRRLRAELGVSHWLEKQLTRLGVHS